MSFEPDILGFACNWCGYAGADQAGMNKMQYPANIKLVRVTCLGRVDTTLVLEAFKKGFDGIMLIGCHIGDCHYVSGNKNAVLVVDRLKNILHYLGIEPERLRIEEVSSGEGPLFVKLVKEFVEEIKELGPSALTSGGISVSQNGKTESNAANQRVFATANPGTSELECIQCSKCQLTCPLNRVDPTYSPRGYTLQLLLDGDKKFTEDKDLYRCLTCFQCKEVCPSSIKFIEAVRQARRKAREKGRMDECKHGMILRTIQQFQAGLHVPQNRLVGLDPDTFAASGDTLYFVGCLPAFDFVFPNTNSLMTAKNTLKILNAAGVKPVVTNDEKCCGYDLLWNGETDAFLKLTESNLRLFKELGIKKIVTSCAECFVTLKDEYPAIEAVDWEVQHITQFIAEALREGDLRLNTPVEEKVTYHDPCRLGRIGHIYEEPRYILKNIAGLDFTEMEFIRENSRCCGVGSFSNCDAYTKFMQTDRLEEAAETGANHVITACPKCRIHLDCYLDGKPIRELPRLNITDITEIVAKAL